MAEQNHEPSSAPASQDNRFPIVGIGASAGGFDALRRLLEAMPDQPNVAIVIVHHLAPDKPSLAPELLSRFTTMNVCQVHDEPVVQPNCVYVIPPGEFLRIANGRLWLSKMEGPRAVPTVIDYFLRALAKDQAERAIAVILSGTGSDGTLGIKAIKEAGGVVFAQDTNTAEYSGMPGSAIETGMVDRILAPEEIPEALVHYASHSYIRSASNLKTSPVRQGLDSEKSLSDLDGAGLVAADAMDVIGPILSLLRKQGHQDFRNYKTATLIRRARRRMCLRQLDSFDDYHRYLSEHPEEIEALGNDLLISVTNFFRDPEAWEELAANVLPEIVESKTSGPHPIDAEEPDRSVRIWIPGCATGEEAYSVAMLAMDEIRKQDKTCAVHVFASDIDAQSLQQAREGCYPISIEADVSHQQLSRYFTMLEGGLHYQVSKQLRDAVVFADQDLIADPPFSKIDLICCRNLLIYLNAETQEKVISLFHFALRNPGYLMLGTAETVGRQVQLFETISKPWRIYRRKDSNNSDLVDLPIVRRSLRRESVSMPPLPPSRDSRMTLIAQLKLLDMVAPRAVMINRSGRILYISGDVDQYLRMVPGAPNDDFFAKLRGQLRERLRGSIRHVFNSQKRVAVNCRVGSEPEVEVRVEVHLIHDNEQNEDLALIVFRDVDDPDSDFDVSDADSRLDDEFNPNASDASDADLIKRLEYELECLRDELRASAEQCRVSDEEYRASNEEVRSINEELQSANEELETSKEEMQSFNEELTTVNQQLAFKVDELETKHADLENLISATDVATICLDTELTIRWFTPAAQKVVRVRKSDFGRPLSELSHDLSEGNLSVDCQQVCQQLMPIEDEVVCRDGRSFIRRIVPYRQADQVSGVVITLLDITMQKSREEALRQSEERFRQALSVDGIGVMFCDSDGRLIDCNDWFLDITGYSRDEVQSRSLTTMGLTPPEWAESTMRKIEMMQRTGRAGPYEKEYFRKDGSRLWMMFSGCSLQDGTVVMHCIDISERKKVEERLFGANQTLENQVQQRTNLLTMLNVLQNITRIANEARTVDEAMQAALDQIARHNGWVVGHLWRSAGDGSGQLESSSLWHVESNAKERLKEFCQQFEQSRYDEGKGLVGMVMQSGKPQWTKDFGDDAGDSRYSDVGLHAVIAIPVIVAKETVAVMEFLSEKASLPENQFLDVMTDIGIQLGHVVARKRLEKIVANIAIAEQKRIGRELHDGIAQQLTGGTLIAVSLRRSLTPEMSSQVEQAEYLIEILKQTHNDVRLLSSGLMPQEIGSADLLPTLRGLAVDTKDRFKIDCEVKHNQFDESLITNDSVAFTTYQIAREAVHNAVKHANANSIVIEVSANDQFHMAVSDDGDGIPTDCPRTNSNGLRIMRYRAESVGGQLDIESSSESGTRIMLTIPKQGCRS